MRAIRTRSSFSICTILTFVIAVATAAFVVPRPLCASLGGDVSTVQSDQARMQATLRTTSKDLYSIHEMQAPNNIVVREFVSSAGKVFGVAWQGPSRPDLQQLLGPYFAAFTQAIQAQKKRGGHPPLIVQEDGLVVRLGGHPRAFVGKAYVPQMVPSGVTAEEIQ
jgi:hypothetical protein